MKAKLYCSDDDCEDLEDALHGASESLETGPQPSYSFEVDLACPLQLEADQRTLPFTHGLSAHDVTSGIRTQLMTSNHRTFRPWQLTLKTRLTYLRKRF